MSIPTAPRLRGDVQSDDVQAVRRIVESTGFFSPAEIDVAVELVDQRLAHGEASGYHFVFAELDRVVTAYACYGPIACTVGSFDLYWIAVQPSRQRRGLGRAVLGEVERRVHDGGARQIYIDTSGRRQYALTREFYKRCGYSPIAVLKDFYAPGDNKVIYHKTLG